jgi:hypothetical protein
MTAIGEKLDKINAFGYHLIIASGITICMVLMKRLLIDPTVAQGMPG